MGRKTKLNGVRDVYTYNSGENISTCLICEKKINGNHLGNLSHHLQKRHNDEFEKLELTADPIEPPRKKVKITLEYDTIEVLDAWINLVIDEGRAFVILDSKSLRYLIKPIFDALELDILTSHTVSDEIKKRTDIMIKNIAGICANRMLSLKIDSATRHFRRVMCINIQFIHNDEIIVLTLSMKELNGPHTAINVKAYVLAVLERYDIKLEQIYSCTQDNGQNLICAAKMLQFHGYNDGEENEDELGNEDQPENEMNDDSLDERQSESEDDDEESVNYLDELKLDASEIVRCAAHTVALSVNDTLNKTNIKPRIKKICKLVELLNTPTYIDKLKSRKLKRPKKHNKTRWNTKYDTILSLLPLKQFCNDEVPEIRLNESDWAFCQSFLDIFKPVKIATKCLQAQQLGLGDFYKIWLKLTLEIKKMTTSSINKSLAEELYNNLLTRESFIFEINKCLVGALYLDPRFRNILTKLRPNQFNVQDAQEHLLALYKQIKKVEKREPRPPEELPLSSTSTSNESSIPSTSAGTPEALPLSSTSTSNESSILSTSAGRLSSPSISTVAPRPNDDEDNILKDFIDDLFEDNPEPNQQVGDDDIVAAFGVICGYSDRKPLDINVLQYWHNKRFSNPILHKLAIVVHAVPATQVSVERCFSILRYILNDYRASMAEDTLENLMLLRLNSRVIKKLFLK